MDTSNPRKRPRENETPSQRNKREKAAERQRRKRERDRSGGSVGATAAAVAAGYVVPQPMQMQSDGQPQQMEYVSAPPIMDLSSDESARRERVRAAARERQRKHRLIVKQRKMRDLGMVVDGPNGPIGLEDYRDSHFAQSLPQFTQTHLSVPIEGGQPGEPPFPQGPHGGQTFATTLLLSFSCAPLLKQHLLRTLNMTNEELASLEPIIADAWDQWDQQRRMRFDPYNTANDQNFPPVVAQYMPQPQPASSTPSSSESVHDAIDPNLGNGGDSIIVKTDK